MKNKIVMLSLLAFAPMASPAKDSTNSAITINFSTATDFDSCLRDKEISVSKDKNVQLVKDVIIAENPGNKLAPGSIYRGVTDPTKFTDTVLGKRVFTLDNPAAEKVSLYVFRGQPGTATLNGHPLKFASFTHHGSWLKAELDGSALHAGSNEIIFGAGTQCPVDRETKPGVHSWISKDAGKTWQVNESGEFYVNIGLTRYPAKGQITSPVIDLANPKNENVLCPLLNIQNMRIEPKVVTPEGTSITFEVRTGVTPLADKTWSAWSDAKTISPARYMQWRASLITSNPMVTPTLQQLSLNANATVAASVAASGVTVEKFDNQRIIRSSLPYSYQRPSEKLTELRKRYKLDEVIAPGKSEWEQLVLLRNWVRRQWPNNDDGPYERDWNALEILGAPDGHHGMCVHYGITFTQCAAALGFNARPLIIQNHFIADAWSNDNGKWAVMDVEAAVKPTHDSAHYIDTATKKPLSMLELHRAFHKALQDGKSQIDTVTQVYYSDANGKSQEMELRPYPMTYLVPKRFIYTPRNDYLDHPEPSEEAHGCDNYHSSAYYWWKSEFPAGEEPQYPFKTNREGDLFWTLNQAQLTLTVADKKDVLNVTAETFTPNVKDFEYKTDSGDWKPLTGKGKDPDNLVATLEWSLHPGKNQLWVRPVNTFDRRGITSYVEVQKKS